MLKTKQIKQTRCMTCGKPITSGFFCAKCVEAGSTEEVKEDGWKGTVFTGERRRKREQQMFREELLLWGKRMAILAAVVLVGFGGWKIFGDRIQVEFRSAATVFRPKDRTDPNNLHPVQLDDKGNPVGTAPVAHKFDR